MTDTRLIMLEGLPGTGKSTNSQLLQVQLDRNGRPAEWIHEVARPHPLLFFQEACLTREEYNAFLQAYPAARPVLEQAAVFREKTVGIDLLDLEWSHGNEIGEAAFQALEAYDIWTFSLEKYKETALERWACFAEKALEEDKTTILDSGIFQYQVFWFLHQNAPYGELEAFIHQLLQIVSPLNPVLINLYRENTEDSIAFVENQRGSAFFEHMWNRDKAMPYYRDKPVGAEGMRVFLRDYGRTARELFASAPCAKLAVEITGGDWPAYEKQILDFLDLPYKPEPRVLPQEGTYRNGEIDAAFEISGLTAKDPRGTSRKLIPRGDNTFYLEGLPTILNFIGNGRLVTAGGHVGERWTVPGTLFKKIT